MKFMVCLIIKKVLKKEKKTKYILKKIKINKINLKKHIKILY